MVNSVGRNPNPQYQSKLSLLKYPASAVIGMATLAGSSFVALPRIYSYYKHQGLRTGMEKAQTASLGQALSIVLTGKDRGKKALQPVQTSMEVLKQDLQSQGVGTAEEAAKLAEGTVAIRAKIESLQRGEALSGGIEGIKSDLSKLMMLPLYQRLKESDTMAVNFLQIVALKLIAVDSRELLATYGKECIGDIGNRGFNPGELGQFIWDYLDQLSFSIDAMHLRIPYMLAHPSRTLHSLSSHTDPASFNASVGNPTHSAHSFQLGDKKMTFYYGPGPTGNPAFEHGVLPAYRKFGAFELRFNHQNTGTRDESVRVWDAVRMAEENRDVLKHVVVGFDPNMDLSGFDSVDSFFDFYAPFMKRDLREFRDYNSHNGFYCPPELFSDSEVDASLELARKLCKELSVHNPFWEKALASGTAGTKRMGAVMKLVADTCLSLGVLYRTFDSVTPEKIVDASFDRDLDAIRVSGACKQDVDRGVLENTTLRLFFRWADDAAPLTQKEVYEISGAVLGRARIVEDRNIMKRRCIILKDFLSFIGASPSGVGKVHKLIHEYKKQFNY